MRKRERGNQVEKQYNNITRWSFQRYEHVIVNSQGRRKKNTIRCSSVTAVKSHCLLLHAAICARQQTVSRECVSLSQERLLRTTFSFHNRDTSVVQVSFQFSARELPRVSKKVSRTRDTRHFRIPEIEHLNISFYL